MFDDDDGGDGNEAPKNDGYTPQGTTQGTHNEACSSNGSPTLHQPTCRRCRQPIADTVCGDNYCCVVAQKWHPGYVMISSGYVFYKHIWWGDDKA